MARIPVVEQDDCIGCEVCTQICPEVFTMNHDIEKSFVHDPDGASVEKIEQAMDGCPAACIYWQD